MAQNASNEKHANAVNEQAARDEHIRYLQRLLATTGALGFGGIGLFHAAKGLKKKIDSMSPKKPDYNALATAMPDFPAQAEMPKIAAEKSALDADQMTALALPLAGAGAGALLNAARSEKGQRLRAALVGAGAGGAAGGAASLLGTRAGGRALTAPLWGVKNIFNSSTGEEGDIFGSHLPRLASRFEGAASIAARPLTAAAGLAGGGYLAHKLINPEKKKQEENVDKIESARREYFDALIGDEKNSAALDKAFSAYQSGDEKKAWWWSKENPSADAYHNDGLWGKLTNDPAALTLAMIGLGSVGAAGVGGTYMYNKTKDRSAAKQLARARIARERLNSLPGAWIDPREVAQVKALASAKPTEDSV